MTRDAVLDDEMEFLDVAVDAAADGVHLPVCVIGTRICVADQPFLAEWGRIEPEAAGRPPDFHVAVTHAERGR